MRKLPLLLAFTALAAAPLLAVSAQTGPVAGIDTGQVRGETTDGISSWKGIPFAAPPVGALRWRAPQPAAKWTGVKDTTAYANDCMQLPFPGDAAPLGTPPAEDCLYVNVWKPAGAATKLPVMVWLYGGGFVNGGASPPTYSGANLAKQGILVVSPNYRVGRFGTFAHPLLTRANADGGMLGNYGFMDQIAALNWVKRNIDKFGGDPANVTVVGESAGGMSVHALVTSPLTKGLFQKAVVMSGSDGAGLTRNTLADAEKRGVAFGVAKGIAADDPQALTKLRALSAEQVTDGLNMSTSRTQADTVTSPFADGKIAVDAVKAYKDGNFAKVPMMIGATSADMGGKTGAMIPGARNLASVISDKGVPVYEYRFSYVADSRARPGAGAGHATDIPFFFNTETIKYAEATTAKDQRAGRLASTYMVNFVKTGNPNGGGLPTWPKYTRAGDELMDLTAEAGAAPGKDPWAADLDAAAPRP